ncbi:hypothetical protein BG015_008195 [Linnemannia schmuckeri]|uniref:Uncharacterized protein n=1 Tax=Linnemannia schmuckeri TaxID=64567 RepID=A0A9P5VAV3_9FUNG|nr:hypothetical protein BG015_008195 [Linnemannia schmuckeri]
MSNIMLPRNAIAIRKTLGTASRAEIVTAVTHKTSTATLLDYPPGAYTGMRTFDKLGIMDFTGHTARLANSLQQIRFPTQDPKIPVSGHSSVEAAATTQRLAPLRRPDVMKEETTNLVKAGLKFYYKNRTDDVLGPADETKVTVLCTWDHKNQEPTLLAHFEPLKTPKTPMCKVEVSGSPRHHPTAKDSQWIRDRSGLEASLDKDSNEALLFEESTQDIYEGLSSNFFAFDRARRTVLTAPLDSVLQGTILKVVVNVCNSENIPVEFKFPNLKHTHEWEGAFISSTSRLVLPIEKLVMPDGSVKVFAPSPTIELIRREVLKECRERVEPILTKEDI